MYTFLSNSSFHDTFDQYFWLEITNSYFLCNETSYVCTKLTDLAFVVFCYNLRYWEYKNIQIMSKLLAKVVVVNIIFSTKNEHGDLLLLLACWNHHSCNICKYKKTYRKVFVKRMRLSIEKRVHLSIEKRMRLSIEKRMRLLIEKRMRLSIE